MSLHVDSCSDTSEPEDDLTRISEPGYRKGKRITGFVPSILNPDFQDPRAKSMEILAYSRYPQKLAH